MFTKKTIRDIDLHGKKVLLRADYNVPLNDGKITDDYRIQKSLPTVEYLLKQDVALIVCSHLGRPKGMDESLSLAPVAERLGSLLGKKVKFVEDCIDDNAQKVADDLKPGEVLLLENLRFHAEEEADDDGFAKQLADLAGADGVFVQDGFGVVHRAHASTVAVAKHLPAVAGLLLEQEVDTITEAMEHPKTPLLTIVGGAKIADKIDVLKRFIEIADDIAIGGAMANTFLAAQGTNVGESLYDKDRMDEARSILKAAATKGIDCIIPTDAVVATTVEADAKTRIMIFATDSLKPGEKILDIGPASAQRITDLIGQAHSVIWNGTMGVTEVKPFTQGTETVIKALTNPAHKPTTLVGGGDTAGYLENRHLVQDFAHVSTGGGASLDLMSGRPLPGVEALLPK
jgi:3-phosphoglycerate kinase